MTGKDSKPDKSNGLLEQFPELDGYLPSGSELKQGRRAFRRALKRARATVAEDTAFRRRPLALNLAGAALALCVFAALVIYALLAKPTMVVADEFMGLRGTVVNAISGTPLPGVYVYATPAGSEVRQLAAVTDMYGAFEVPPDPQAAQVHLELMHEGRTVGTAVTGEAETLAKGYQDIPVSVIGDAGESRHALEVAPGTAAQPTPEVSVTLAADESQLWQGVLVEDREWPSAFNFGNIVKGIVMLDGPEGGRLTLSASLPREVFQLTDQQPDELQLVAYSQAWHDYTREHDRRSYYYNQGWVTAGKLTEKQRKLCPELTGLELSISKSGGYVLASWPAAPGTGYALLLPPTGDGEVTLTSMRNERYAGYADKYINAVTMVDARYSNPWLYDYEYTLPDGSQTYYTSGFLRPITPLKAVIDNSITLALNHQPNLDSRLPEIPGLRETGKPFGDVFCLRHDFTQQNARRYTVQNFDTSKQPGEYDVKVHNLAVGEFAVLEVVGDLDRLAGPPAWDFHDDFMNDAWGTTARLLIPRPGAYSYRVILREADGAVVVLRENLLLPGGNTVAFKAVGANFIAQVAEPPETPPAAASLRVLSSNAVASASGYGASAGYYGGPAWLVDPPAGFRHTELKELRVYHEMRALAGDALGTMPVNSKIYLNYREPRESGGGLLLDGKVFEHPVLGDYSGGRLDLGGFLWWPYAAVERALDPENTAPASDLITGEMLITDIHYTAYDYYFGLDLDNMPDNEGLIAALKPWTHGPYRGFHYATPERELYEYAAPLKDIMLEDDDAITIGFELNNMGLPYSGQWEFYSGGENPSRIELETADGRVWTRYLDYSLVK